jgi:DNA-directed RNA polymerase specialized sigma24 family protein
LIRPKWKLADGKLVEQARQDPRAFGQVYDRYLDPIYRYIYNRTGNPADAEDITSKLFWPPWRDQKYRETGTCGLVVRYRRRKVADHYRSSRSLVDLDEVQFIWIDHEMDGSLIGIKGMEDLQKILLALLSRIRNCFAAILSGIELLRYRQAAQTQRTRS